MVDLFQSTLSELHQEAPIELLRSLRTRLEGMRDTNPNSARAAEACLHALASDSSPLLHVLTAAYIVNGGVMLKQLAADDAAEEAPDLDFNFRELEEELAQLQCEEPRPTELSRARPSEGRPRSDTASHAEKC
jgi:hypothetical protein